MTLYFDVGTPKGHDLVIDPAFFELTPKLISLSAIKGMVGGSIITARVEGLGMSDSSTISSTGVNLADNTTGVNICQTVTTKE
jgi:hypothetical protein